MIFKIVKVLCRKPMQEHRRERHCNKLTHEVRLTVQTMPLADLYVKRHIGLRRCSLSSIFTELVKENSKSLLLALLFVVIIFISGCIQPQTVGGGLFVTLTPDPSKVFASGEVRVNVDIDNQNPRRVTDVEADIFDAGIFNILGTADYTQSGEYITPGACGKFIEFMLPDDFKTLSCLLMAPQKTDLAEDTQKSVVSSRVSYTTELPVVQLIEMMTESEYITRLERGQLAKKPSSFVYRDKNVEIIVEFSDEMPIVVRPDREYLMYITIKNIGNGFIGDIDDTNLRVSPVGYNNANIARCDEIIKSGWSLKLQGKEFPRVACRLELPTGVTVVENYGLEIALKYRYEVRGKTEITVIR